MRRNLDLVRGGGSPYFRDLILNMEGKIEYLNNMLSILFRLNSKGDIGFFFFF